MGNLTVFLQIGNVSETQINTMKAALDAQIVTWRAANPTMTFTRDRIDWKEVKTVSTYLRIGDVTESQVTTVKTALDTRIASWTSTYPSLSFSRGEISWME